MRRGNGAFGVTALTAGFAFLYLPIVLLVIGFGALACTWLTGYIVPAGNDILDAAVSVVLLLIAIVCLFGAARIGKRIRQASATGAAK